METQERFVGYEEIESMFCQDSRLGSCLGLTVRGSLWVLCVSPFIVVSSRYRRLRQAWQDHLQKVLVPNERLLLTLHEQLRARTGADHYLRHSEVQSLLADVRPALEGLPRSNSESLWSSPAREALFALREFESNPEQMAREAREAYLARALNSEIAPKGLSLKQHRAVLTDDDRNLVLAPAGSGKTATIVAKVQYLLDRGFPPEQLLVLAFNRGAQQELADRIANLVGNRFKAAIQVKTFHGLGNHILRCVRTVPPTLAPHANDRGIRRKLVGNLIEELCGDSLFHTHVMHWLSRYARWRRSRSGFQNATEWKDYVARNAVTMNGEKVKSFGEVQIADYLYLHGVNYQYESPYPSQETYHPDFFLPEQGIYIEHFGIDRSGNTAPDIDRDKYRTGMDWKRWVHKENGTILLETFYYQQEENTLLEHLHELLEKHNVPMHPLAPGNLGKGLGKSRTYIRFLDLLSNVLLHAKSSLTKTRELYSKATAFPDRARFEIFLSIFGPFRDKYEELLAESGEIDFEDMVNQATAALQAKQYWSPFTYILVDEFQDLSVCRARFIQALLAQSPNAQLFGVGDDWQSIYKFAGSDISLMTRFEDWFGPVSRTELELSYRCVHDINQIAAEFVQRNPGQSQRKTIANRADAGPALFLVGGNTRIRMPELLAELDKDPVRSGQKVLILGRYNHSRPDKWQRIVSDCSNLQLEFSTVHRAKGREADVVLVLDLNVGPFGFPSEQESDPLLNLVLADPETYLHAEERRLFYVALTRARNTVFLMFEENNPSHFIKELQHVYPDQVTHWQLTEGISDPNCPACSTGHLMVIKGRYGAFVGCDNFPDCSYKTSVCSHCDKGIVARSAAEQGACCTLCGHEQRDCPACNGHLVKRKKRQRSTFLGCSLYPECTYTEKLTRARE